MADEKNEARSAETDPAPVDDVVVDEAAVEGSTDDAETTGSEGSDEGQAAKADGPSLAKGSKDADDPKDAEGSAGTDEKRKAAKAKADAAVAERTVTRRVVTSKRVTPKAGAKPPAGAAEPSTPSKARNAKVTETIQARYTPPTPTYAKGPSPWWVPTIMFGLLIVGALVIMLNYMGVFGEAANIRLVIGLAFILGGIVTATQYR